jgi:hypothetical protein
MRKTWIERNFRLSLSRRWIRDLSSRQLLVQIADVVNSEREQNELKIPYQHPFVNVVEMINKGQKRSISSVIYANVTVIVTYHQAYHCVGLIYIASWYKNRQMGQYFS